MSRWEEATLTNMQKAHYWRDKAFISINQLATNGHAFSQYQLGTLYNTVDKNELFAVEWYRKAADQGNAYAQSNLAYMIMHGKGIRQSDREAERWYRKAAEQGVARAQFNLGYIYIYIYIYENGKGVKQNDKEAERWYRKAAEQELARAQSLPAMESEREGW